MKTRKVGAALVRALKPFWMRLCGYRRVGEVRLDVIHADGTREKDARVVTLWARHTHNPTVGSTSES